MHVSKYVKKSNRELGDMQIAEEEHLDCLDSVRESVRAADARIAALAVAFDESGENRGYLFDHRDGSRVHRSVYRNYGSEEKEGIFSAEEERLERMGYN